MVQISSIFAGKIPSSGDYKIRDVISGHTVEIRGKVVNGVVNIGTAFVDNKCC